MIRYTIAETLKQVSELPSKQEKVKALAQNKHGAINLVLRYIFDKRIKFLLPEGTPPYKKSTFKDPNRLYPEVRRLYLFVEGGNPNLSPMKREMIFLDILENVDEDEAEMLIAIKDRKNPFKGLTADIVLAVYPGLFPK